MLAAQSCPALCDPMDSSLPGSSVHGMLQARILEWFAMPFSEVLYIMRYIYIYVSPNLPVIPPLHMIFVFS